MINDTEFRQVSQDRIGALWTDAAEAAHDPALVSQVRFVVDKLVDCRFHRADLGIEMCNEIENGGADQIIAALMTTRFLFRTSINKLLFGFVGARRASGALASAPDDSSPVGTASSSIGTASPDVSTVLGARVDTTLGSAGGTGGKGLGTAGSGNAATGALGALFIASTEPDGPAKLVIPSNN